MAELDQPKNNVIYFNTPNEVLNNPPANPQLEPIEMVVAEGILPGDLRDGQRALEALQAAKLPTEWAAVGLNRGHGYKLSRARTLQPFNTSFDPSKPSPVKRDGNLVMAYSYENKSHMLLEEPKTVSGLVVSNQSLIDQSFNGKIIKMTVLCGVDQKELESAA